MNVAWICPRCGSSEEIFWDETINELVCRECGKVFDKEMPRTNGLIKDHISERGTCECCGLENAHLVFKCKKCGRKICLEYCYEIAETEDSLCPLCAPKIVSYSNKTEE